MNYPCILSLLTVFLFGCVTTPGPNAEFVGSVNFSELETFDYKHTLISGMDFRAPDEYLIKEMSEAVLSRALASRGFESVDSGSDFYVVTKWKKAVSSYPQPFDSINGPFDSYSNRNNPSHKFGARLHLTVEVYETDGDRMFWRKDLPNIFDAVELTEERLNASLLRAIENFPKRVEKDPSLPDLD
ncbi:MAG: hypothetical protein ABF322_01455 [Lentimonas sp.]